MNQKFNYVFCKHKNDIEYCCENCNKSCPSVINLWYRYIRNPIINFIKNIRYGFKKCNHTESGCSFRYRNKYCLLKNRSCYSNRKHD